MKTPKETEMVQTFCGGDDGASDEKVRSRIQEGSPHADSKGKFLGGLSYDDAST